MNTPKDFSWTLKIIIGIASFAIGVVATCSLIALLLEWRLSAFETLYLISTIAMIGIAIATIGFTYLSIQTQKKQWLNESFIKHESEVLLNFSRAFGEAFQSIAFFESYLLRPYKFDRVPKQAPLLTRKELALHFNNLLELNNLYNQDQHIFRKHKLELPISCVTLYLDSAMHLPVRDLKYVKVEETKNSCTYHLEYWDQISKIFVFSAQQLLDQPEGKALDIEQLQANLSKDQESERERLLMIAQQHISTLRFELDKLTMFDDGNCGDNINNRRSKFYKEMV